MKAGIRKSRLLLCCTVLAAALSGCAYNVAYNPGYVAAARRPAAQVVEGRVLVLTERADDAYVYTGHPTSLTGSATTLTIPLGEITRRIALAVYGDMFKGGAEASNTLEDPARYALVIHPKLVNYTYEYNQLKNIGFAITPTVRVSIKVALCGADGKPVWEKIYASGDVEGETYMISGSPEETIDETTHKAIYDLLVRSTTDVLPRVAKTAARTSAR